MRMKHKYDLAEQVRRPVLDPADGGVAVFHRKWETAAHAARAHALKLTCRHTARHNKSFGAAADRAKQRPHAQLAGAKRTELFLADFGAAWPDIPKLMGNFFCPAYRHFRALGWTTGTSHRVISLYLARIDATSEVITTCWNAPHRTQQTPPAPGPL